MNNQEKPDRTIIISNSHQAPKDPEFVTLNYVPLDLARKYGSSRPIRRGPPPRKSGQQVN